MYIDLSAPAILPLGLIRTGTSASASLLGLTLKYPLTQVSAQKRGAHLTVTGPRANLAHAYASRYLAHHQRDSQLEVAIEWAIANNMGLGSEPILGLSVARALAGLNTLPTNDTPALAQAVGVGPEHALALWGFHQGGALLVGLEGTPPTVLARATIAHESDQVWAFVFHFPHVPDDVSATLEADRVAALRQAAPHLSLETGTVFNDQLWPAIKQDNITTFAQAVMRIDQLNREALELAGTPAVIRPEAQATLNVFQSSGALAWGQCLTGIGLFGLVKGTEASQQLRHKLRAHVGYYAGTQLAAIVDNDGARHTLKDGNLDVLWDVPIHPISGATH